MGSLFKAEHVSGLCSSIFLCCVLLFSSNPAMAQGSSDAKAKFLEGMALIKKENFSGALQAFNESYALKPKPQALFNIGMCQKALAQYVEAMDSFTRYLDDPAAKNKIEKRKKAKAAIEEMKGLVASLEITKAPNGALVKINGKKIGKFPLIKAVKVNPGSHTVFVSKQGYRSFEKELHIVSGEKLVVPALLEIERGSVDVRCSNKDAKIKLDGKDVGGCPYKGEVEAGTHEIIVEAPGKKRAVEKIEVKPAKEAVVAVMLEDEAVLEPVADKPLPAEPVLEKDGNGKNSGLLVGGVVLTALGLGAGGTGIYFVSTYNDHLDDGKVAADGFNQTGEAEYQEDYNDAKDSMSKDRVGMAVSFALSGVLLATGTVLMIVGASGDNESEVAVTPTLNGLSVRF